VQKIFWPELDLHEKKIKRTTEKKLDKLSASFCSSFFDGKKKLI